MRIQVQRHGGWPKNRRLSHAKIGGAIEEARLGLGRETLLPWGISRDRHYQISNRFAWAWKLTQLGVPVVLVYLGFLNATEMNDRGTPFTTHGDWKNLVLEQSSGIVPNEVWDRRWNRDDRALIPLFAQFVKTSNKSRNCAHLDGRG